LRFLQSRIDAIYIDKLDRKIGEDYFLEKSEEWRKEQEKLREAIERHEKANVNYLTS